ncbi:ATP-dependent zinc metalloprotease FtsH [Desulfosarcina sp. OttesenSCG-928-A07]|nr:ATP-dependent zinc metalloprotease FtsH [Desulfosarcina sp. OttesenSCG-928-A07]
MNKKQGFNVGYFLMMPLVMWIFSEFIYKPMIVSNTQVPYSEFLADLGAEKIDEVTLEDQRIVYTLKGSDISRLSSSVRNTVRVDDPGIVERLIEAGVTFSGVAASRNAFDTIIGMLLPFIPLMLIWYFIFKKMGGQNNPMMTIGKNKAQEIQGEMTGVKFSDVGGVGEAETELREIIDFLKEPNRFKAMGAKLPKGVLLVGPPGTGKTLLAKATAGEAGVTFFSMTGSSFVEMFVGVGAARVRDLFEQAKQKAPCIIFIDEIDAIGQSRTSSAIPGGGNSEQTNTLNQLLAEMDGFQSNIGVVIMAATNRPEILDPALVRPGRFDRQIQVVLPTEEGRLHILKIHTKNMPLAADVRLDHLAKVTPGFSGADLANIANEASLLAVRDKKTEVAMKHFDLAVERVVAGLQRKAPLSDEVRRKVAYHEIGHALAAFYQPEADPVHKISIIPTAKGALGYTMQMPSEDQYLMGENALKSRLVVMLGGRAAELLVFGEATTGASNDLERATELARRMVTEFGMSSELGPVRYAAPTGAYLQSFATSRNDIGSDTVAAIDREIHKLIVDAQKQAQSILRDHEAVMHEVAGVLQKEEVITGDRMRELAEKIEGAPRA